MKLLVKIILSLLATVIISVLDFFLIFFITCYFMPPRTSDGHGVMPIGQVFIAFLLSSLIGIGLLWFFLKKYDKIIYWFKTSEWH